jgi:DNA-binding GntR family transcriptional regulator
MVPSLELLVLAQARGFPRGARLQIVYNIIFNIANLRLMAYQRTLENRVMALTKSRTTVAGRRAPAKPSPHPRGRKPAVAERIAARLEEDIVLGRRHPRERLIEQDLCDRFDTHRGDVRLALFELEKKGLIERIPNRGAMVRDLTPKEVKEIYAVREELEVMAARILPFPVSTTDLAKLDELQKKHSAAVDGGDLLTVFYTNLHFHQALFGLCGNACLIETIERLAQRAYGIRSYANAFPEALDRVRRDHVEMIEALRGSRRNELIELTRRHLQPSRDAYIRAYEQRFGVPSTAKVPR